MLAFFEANQTEKPPIQFSRFPYIPSMETFSIPPIREFVERWTAGRKVIVDPFARNSTFGTITNDLNPNTIAQYHLDAREFLDKLIEQGVQVDACLLDPPYSPRQIAECYQGIGLKPALRDVQISRLYKDCKNKLTSLMRKGSIALTFGWTSAGFSPYRGFEIREIRLIYHGSGRNDTICVAEEKVRDS